MLRAIEDELRPQAGRREDLFLAATSFEPRSMNLGSLWKHESVERSLVFRYADTLDIELGRRHTEQLVGLLKSKSRQFEVIDCSFSDPYSVVRGLLYWRKEKRLEGESIKSITIDITCFTKLQLLLLLRTLRAEFSGAQIRITYTEPRLYASSYRRPLSYGVANTFYIPYVTPRVPAGQSALFLFLGHELLRAEKVVDELEPEVTILIQGEPGYSKEMVATSHKNNRVLLSKVKYDHQYRLMSTSCYDFESAAGKILGLIRNFKGLGFGSFYLAPLGTKLQCLAFDIVSLICRDERLLLAYAMPHRYERKYYSQGVGRAWEWSYRSDLQVTPVDSVEVAGVFYSDPFQVPYERSDSFSEQEEGRAKGIVIGQCREALFNAFESEGCEKVVLSDGKIAGAFGKHEEIDREWLDRLQGSTGRRAFTIVRTDLGASV